MERTQWDGAQVVAEWRTAEGSPTGITSGSVSYVYLDQLDQPVGLLTGDTTRVVQYTWRWLAEGTVFIDGTPGDCSIFTTGCLRVRWPAATQGAVYYTPNLLDTNQGPSTNDRWFGTLLANGQGTTGQVFRRHRFFDPASGQFTQEDPIGIGGGLNLWGLASGDPVNFADPFGLCPEWLTGRPCPALADVGAGFVPGLSTGVDVATALAGENPLTGERVGLFGRGVALAGALTPFTGGQIRGAGKLLEKLTNFLGAGTRGRLNDAGDLLLQSQDELREVRFDFNKFGPHDAPHVHVIEYEWVKNKKVEIFNERVFPPSGVSK